MISACSRSRGAPMTSNSCNYYTMRVAVAVCGLALASTAAVPSACAQSPATSTPGSSVTPSVPARNQQPAVQLNKAAAGPVDAIVPPIKRVRPAPTKPVASSGALAKPASTKAAAVKSAAVKSKAVRSASSKSAPAPARSTQAGTFGAATAAPAPPAGLTGGSASACPPGQKLVPNAAHDRPGGRYRTLAAFCAPPGPVKTKTAPVLARRR